ncbi:MAG TPA: amino acid adenylation domain-containing protein, partial [Pyrinomonadaceae bacterium]|nr:amino acid adenylation domain-containing protein [Pyrinomonadaceae bacterium]
MVRELASLYEAYASGKDKSPLEELEIQYADYALWQREHLTGGVLDNQLDYWREQLSGDLPVLQLPSEKPRSIAGGFRAGTQTFVLPGKLLDELKALSLEEDATLFMTLISAFKVLLWRYSGQTDLTVGTPIAGRTRAETEPLIGFFVNTLVLRTRLEAGMSFRELLEREREVCLGAYAHQDVPFERLVEELQPERSLSHTPLFQVMFALQNAPAPVIELSGLKLSLLESDTGAAQFDLTLEMSETADGLRGLLLYNAELFEAGAMARMAEHFRTLLESVAANPCARISQLPLLTADEARQQLSEWNATDARYPRDACVHELFERRAGETPDAVALRFDGGQLTYAELNRRANKLARRLKNLGIGDEARVGVLLERSPEMVVALVGILKAGGCYVPLDSQYPRERLRFMAEDAQVSVLLTQKRSSEDVRIDGARLLLMDEDWPAVERESGENFPSRVSADNLAYVMYTSGSTGRPKGTGITHRAISRLVINTNYIQLNAADRIAQVSNTSFDAATFEIWGALLHGAQFVIIDRNVTLSPEEFAAKLADERISAMFLTTALFNQLAASVPGAFKTLRYVLAGGEVGDPSSFRRVLEHGAPAHLLNVYGPTESTTFATAEEIEAVDAGAVTLPIGRPIANTRAYILDQEMSIVPVGVSGEIYIGGDGLARGYLNRPELTAERFVPDPFGGEAGARLYRTGDLARYGDDGRIEFVGRRDNQVKIRGFRVELEEIKAALDKHPSVRESLVTVREDAPGDKRLVAYLSGAAGATPVVDELRTHLRESLPAYMVPSAFVTLAEFPLTANGKIDRRALPAPGASVEERPETYVAPRNAVEEALARIVSEVLGVEHVGVCDNFFELGGHSLLATQVVSRVREAFQLNLPLRQFFETPVIAELAVWIESRKRNGQAGGEPTLVPVPREKALPLSFAQQRLWFLDQLESGNPIYNMPAAVRLRGRLDVDALERTLDEIVRRHESLRTIFRVERGEPVQVILPRQSIPLPVLSLAGLPEADREAEAERLATEEARKGFDLSRGPLLRSTLLRLSTEEHVLLFTMHHITSDGWSVGVLVNEVATLYAAYAEGLESPLAELKLQYADYAVWQRGWLQGEALKEHLAYWKKQLDLVPPVLQLPADRPRPAVMSFRGASVNLEFPAHLTEALKELSRREGVTLYMTLLAAFQTLLCRYTGEQDIVVGSPIANRQTSEIEPLIGFFANTLVLRTDLSGDPAFTELLSRVQEVTLGAYAHQEVPFEMLVEELQPERNLSHTPLFQVVFALQNAPGEELKLPGLALDKMDVRGDTSKFDLTLQLEESRHGLTGVVEYSLDLFDEATVRRFAVHLRTLLEAIVADPQARISALPLLADAERHQLLDEWSHATDESDLFERRTQQCVQHLFEQQAGRTPERVALVFGEQKLTYGELNARADALAHRLRTLGAGPDVVVAVMSESSVEMMLGILGVLKAGGAYVILDPAHPRERLAFMLRDSAARAVLTEKQWEARLPEDCDLPVADISEADSQTLPQDAGENPAHAATPENLACLVYTSDSTGLPKAVGVDHRPLVNLIEFLTREARVSEPPRTLQLSPPVLDVSFREIFSTWCAGGTLVLAAHEARRDSGALWRLLSSENVERLFLPSETLRHLAEVSEATETLPRSLRRIITTDEGLKINGRVRDLFAGLPQCALDNHYGSPETSLATAFRLDGPASEWPHAPSIGRPVADARVYVLDARLQPVPIGVVGELYVGGSGLARGYVNRADLTAERFIPDAFGGEPGARLYKTGDLVRYLGDGRLEYVGRVDNRVNVRGQRIELGEVESVLRQHAAISQVVVKAWEDEAGRARLVAYVIGAAGATPTSEELRAYLREKLPAYMIPSTFLMLDSLPLVPNGRLPGHMIPSAFLMLDGSATHGRKVDRSALPNPFADGFKIRECYAAPQTPTEEILAGIWSSVLKVEHVGTSDSFFDLGGHSLLATQLMSRVRDAFHVEIPLRRLFEQPTVAGLAKTIEASVRAGRGLQLPPIGRAAREGNLPLSFAQQRLWFIDQLQPDSSTYNLSSAVNISGPLDVEALERSLAEILRRHEVLRTSFVVSDGQPMQVISPDSNFSLTIVDLSARTRNERDAEKQRLTLEEARKPFDLRESPQLRARLLRLSAEEHVLLLTMHHIVSDGWSVGVMVRELASLYEAYASGKDKSPLEELEIQYADYALWQREH